MLSASGTYVSGTPSAQNLLVLERQRARESLEESTLYPCPCSYIPSSQPSESPDLGEAGLCEPSRRGPRPLNLGVGSV